MRTRLGILLLVLLLPWADAPAQSSLGLAAEVQKLEERIGAAQRDSLEKYETALQEVQLTAQKAADLESALAIRDELQRLRSEGALTDKHLLPAPKTLRTLQQQTADRMQDLVSHLVQETLPKLVEMRKSLTVAGRLDEALAVRKEIERLQDAYLPLVPASDTLVTPAETLLTAYAADRTRADKVYKGRSILVRGIVGGFRPAPGEAGAFHLFLTGGSGGGWVQALLGAKLRAREERGARGVAVLAIAVEGGDTVRVQKGQTLELRGTCDGFEETVRLSKCELLR